MTDENTTDETEQPSRDELAQRVEQLEQTVQQMLPSRRDALKLGGTALSGLALGSAATGSASAGTNSVGTIGSPSSPVDAELEDVNPGSVRAVNFNNNEITNVSSLSTEKVVYDEGYTVEEDDNSPFNESGAQSHTLSFSSSYDKVILDGSITNDSGSSQRIDLQINSQTNNYFYRLTDGSTEIGDTKFLLADSLGPTTMSISEFAIYVKSNDKINAIGPVGIGTENGILSGALGSGSFSTVNRLTIKGGSGNISLTDFRVRGVAFN